MVPGEARVGRTRRTSDLVDTGRPHSLGPCPVSICFTNLRCPPHFHGPQGITHSLLYWGNRGLSPLASRLSRLVLDTLQGTVSVARGFELVTGQPSPSSTQDERTEGQSGFEGFKSLTTMSLLGTLESVPTVASAPLRRASMDCLPKILGCTQTSVPSCVPEYGLGLGETESRG